MTVAHGLAVARWGADPCGGKVTVARRHMGPGINALSRWLMTSRGDPATYFNCTISYNLDVRWDWPKLCVVVEHELGHRAGTPRRRPRRRDVAYYVRPTPECATARPGAGAASTTVKHRRRSAKPRRRQARRGRGVSAKRR